MFPVTRSPAVLVSQATINQLHDLGMRQVQLADQQSSKLLRLQADVAELLGWAQECDRSGICPLPATIVAKIRPVMERTMETAS